jgi:hypothetical protein
MVYVAVTFTCCRYLQFVLHVSFTFVVWFGSFPFWFLVTLVCGSLLRWFPDVPLFYVYVPLLRLRSFAFALPRALPFGYWFPFRFPFVYVRSVHTFGWLWFGYVTLLLWLVTFRLVGCCCLVRSLVLLLHSSAGLRLPVWVAGFGSRYLFLVFRSFVGWVPVVDTDLRCCSDLLRLRLQRCCCWLFGLLHLFLVLFPVTTTARLALFSYRSFAGYRLLAIYTIRCHMVTEQVLF